jgi:hypothetical protein
MKRRYETICITECNVNSGYTVGHSHGGDDK